jgi:hypothetical protein
MSSYPVNTRLRPLTREVVLERLRIDAVVRIDAHSKGAHVSRPVLGCPKCG